MGKWLILTVIFLFAAGQAWADCAWVLVVQKKYPAQLVSAPFVSVRPDSYYETQKECLNGKKMSLDFEATVQGQQVLKQSVARKDEKGREAYFSYECIPSNVLTLFIRAER